MTPVLRSRTDATASARIIDIAVGGRVDVGDFVVPGVAKLVTISGTVVDSSNRPLSQASVVLLSSGSRSIEIGPPVTTDDAGRFHLAGIDGAIYVLQASWNRGFLGGRAQQLEVRASVGSSPITITVPVRDPKRP